MPQMGVSVSEGTVVEWRKSVGDHIDRDEIICSISTDKIDTDVESPGEGTLAEILVERATTVDGGAVLGRIEGSAASGEAAAALGDTPAPTVSEPAPVVEASDGNGGRPRRYSPVVQRIAAEHGIDLSTVEGTGRGGRVRKQDVLARVQGGGERAPPAAARGGRAPRAPPPGLRGKPTPPPGGGSRRRPRRAAPAGSARRRRRRRP